MHEKETVVISVGGALIVPDKIDIDFLRSFRTLIQKEVEDGRRFVIIAGGGKTARNYMHVAEELTDLSRDDLDWIGIHATRLNAHLLRTIFHDLAHPVVIRNPHEDIETEAPVVIAAGWKPGWSTDYVATLLAKNMQSKRLVNLSDIDFVYTDDPKKNPEARSIEEISWANFLTLIPTEWDPGLSSPFDPVASREAQNADIEVAIMNGSRPEELKKYLRGEPFIGTRIR